MTEGGAGAVFALLDDCDSTALARSSRLYTGFVREHASTDPAQTESLCAQVSADLRQGLHALVLGDYGFGRELQRGTHGDGRAALRFLMFSHCERLSREEADAWLARAEAPTLGAASLTPGVAGIAQLERSVTREQFEAAINAVHAALRAGDSYQINYTYRLGFEAYGSPVALYRRLRARQPVRYGALIALPGDAWVLSCSPELFVEKTGAQLRARPMKGTAPRHANAVQDRRIADALAGDAKNRAENLMIVDLLRNDLSRVARIGSVRVPALFSVEPYRSVWQMTSTVEAELREGASLAEILRALFPCGSITGAPKHRTLELIDALETTPRGLYTGMIGWLDAPQASQPDCGDFCLSVAIRTLTLEPSAAAARRRGLMGVGAGIVLDSVAADEYAECELKAGFLTGADPGFQLFETMYATPRDGVRHLDRHLARLSESARVLGFGLNECELLERIEASEMAIEAEARRAQGAGQSDPSDGWRLRLALSKDGTVELTHARLAPLATSVKVMLAQEHGFAPLDSGDLLLQHKTTRRADYDRAWKLAEQQGAFDMLFLNEKGELAEGGRSNVFVKLDGHWYTPPLAAGVLPGVMRGVLLEDGDLQASERVLTLDDLRRADAVLLCNALRGAVVAEVLR
jgi:para-aminobenzoate synthetase / 4-amino-4-deoxychorismate lyase